MNRKLTSITRIFIITVIVMTAAMLTYSCHPDRRERLAMDRAECLMETHPDSSLAIFDSLDPANIRGRAGKARFALLKSMALDKNYVDTADFSVLQPAIDYYLSHGNPDQKLRTYYYQGCIYLNKNEYDSAMTSFLNGLELQSVISDSLTLARLLVAQGTIQFREYDLEEVRKANILAAEIFGRHNQPIGQLKCYDKIANTYIIEDNKEGARKYMTLCNELDLPDSVIESQLQFDRFSYDLYFGTEEELGNTLGNYSRIDSLPHSMKLLVAKGFSKIGDKKKSFEMLDKVDSCQVDSLQYAITCSEIYSNTGDYRRALEYFRAYNKSMESYHVYLFDHDICFAEKHHQLEIANIRETNRRNNIIILSIGGSVILLLVIAVIILRLRINRMRMLVLRKKNDLLSEQRDSLVNDNRILKKEKSVIESELDQEKNLSHELKNTIKELQSDKETFRNLSDINSVKADNLRDVLRGRLKLLNEIFTNDYVKFNSSLTQSHASIEKIMKDKNRFLHDMKEAIALSYPELYAHLLSCGIEGQEMDVVCLHIIGLTGKEVGRFIETSRLYHINSNIRQKLRLTKTDPNLKNYLQRLIENQYKSGLKRRL